MTARKFAYLCAGGAAVGFTATWLYLAHSIGRAVRYIGRTL